MPSQTSDTPNAPQPEPLRIDVEEMAPDYVAVSRAEADRRASLDRITGLEERIAFFSAKTEELRTKLSHARQRRDDIESYGGGWPIAIVTIAALITAALEYVPAYLFTQVFSSDAFAWRMLIIAFTVIPAILAIALGELIRRLRERAEQGTMDRVLLITVALVTLGFLTLGYELRVTYTAEVAGGGRGLRPWIEAVALTSIAAIGVLITVVSAYYRESVALLGSRRAVSKLAGLLSTNETYLKANERDLQRANGVLRSKPPQTEETVVRRAPPLKSDEYEVRASSAGPPNG